MANSQSYRNFNEDFLIANLAGFRLKYFVAKAFCFVGMLLIQIRKEKDFEWNFSCSFCLIILFFYVVGRFVH